jgi:ubiquinone/menaquinone biosynthesis C-methylase UbiE
MRLAFRKSDYESYNYTKFWEDSKRLYEDKAERLALRKLLAGVDGTKKFFFDIGCGYGRLFNEYKHFENIVLIDYSIKNLKNARRKIRKFLGNSQRSLSSVHLIAADAAHLPLKSKCADVVLTVRMVHHLDDPEMYFSEVARILKGGGLYFLEFANKRNLKNILRYFIGKMDTSPFNLLPSQVGETIMNFHPRYITVTLKKRKFAIKKMISVSNFRLNILKRFPGTKTLVFFEKLYQRIIPFVLLGPSVFLKSILEEKKQEKIRTDLKVSLKDIVLCPYCRKQSLFFRKNMFVCTHCGSTFKQKNGIYDFRIKT